MNKDNQRLLWEELSYEQRKGFTKMMAFCGDRDSSTYRNNVYFIEPDGNLYGYSHGSMQLELRRRAKTKRK